MPCQDGIQRDRGSDDGDNKDELGEPAHQHATVGARADDVVRIVQDRLVQRKSCHGGDLCDQE
ncbi:hypothetical protein OHA42_19670 [Nocardia sp. NBC_01009]|nr:hypothetical protein OHA42_19670 [Nocardia sp. NBC_01009]